MQITFKFELNQQVKVICLGIETIGRIVERHYAENFTTQHIKYHVFIDAIKDFVTPTEDDLIELNLE